MTEQPKLPYQDAGRPVEERVADLMARMTLEEKVGQMCQMDGRREPERWVRDKNFGSLCLLQPDSWLAWPTALHSSVTTPVKELKAFGCVDLEPGESRTVELSVPYAGLSTVNQELETVVEPGEFEVMVGSSSRDQDLLKASFHVVG
jgi:hypothetical protein